MGRYMSVRSGDNDNDNDNDDDDNDDDDDDVTLHYVTYQVICVTDADHVFEFIRPSLAVVVPV